MENSAKNKKGTETLLERIYGAVEMREVQAYDDLYYMCKDCIETDTALAVKYLKKLSEHLMLRIPHTAQLDLMKDLFELHKKTLLLAAPYDFDSYLLYVEWDRDPCKKFYIPRRGILKPLVDDLQDLADGRLDFLGISLPPRVGKSTLCIFFMTWIMGRFPSSANVMSGHSDKLTDGFYRELLSIMSDREEYLWHEVFPGVPIVDNSAKNETIDLEKRKRFPTMTCRSISGTLTGAVEVGSNGILYCDDLIEDLEESLNPQRLQNKYDAYLNQLKDRKKLGAKELMVGTRWNRFDPLGRIQDQYEGNERYRFRVIPALDADDHSNFNYAYGLGFDDAYFHDMRASIDDATWWAKFMGQPYIREGLLFPENELNYYNGVLPDGDPMKIAVCDVAWGGGDSLAMVFAYQYGDAVYIHDVIYNNGDKTVTYPEVIGKLKKHQPSRVRFEANNGGHEFSDHVDQALRADGVRLNVFSKKTSSKQGKLAKIIQYAPDVKKFYFLSPQYRDREYRGFMNEVTLFTQNGKVLHDDAPDCLAMTAEEIYHGVTMIEVFKRPW